VKQAKGVEEVKQSTEPQQLQPGGSRNVWRRIPGGGGSAGSGDAELAGDLAGDLAVDLAGDLAEAISGARRSLWARLLGQPGTHAGAGRMCRTPWAGSRYAEECTVSAWPCTQVFVPAFLSFLSLALHVCSPGMMPLE